MARASAPPLYSLDLEAWERSIDVNVNGFAYCLSASLPALREGEGGCMAVLSVEDPAGTPDPFLRASQAAVRVILAGVVAEYPNEICVLQRFEAACSSSKILRDAPR